jgi:hypothetical protein
MQWRHPFSYVFSRRVWNKSIKHVTALRRAAMIRARRACDRAA